MTLAPKLAAHGAEIPAIGFGTSGMGDVRAEHIAAALKVGYRHIDTARKYGTERVVGEVLTLPLHSLMKEAHIERVIDGVRSFFGS